jgi:ribosomal protein S17
MYFDFRKNDVLFYLYSCRPLSKSKNWMLVDVVTKAAV